MAARKKKPTRKETPTQGGAPGGIVRFKSGFPPGIREAIRKRFGDNWHLSLQILDGDDGDGDDGDGDDGQAGAAPRAGRGGSVSAKAGAAKSPTRSRKKRVRR